MNKDNFNQYDLSDEIQGALKGLGYDKPTEVQGKVIPVALVEKDLVVKSQTGSGKTAAYGIPICELVDWMENKPQALILTPTRELAVQVRDDMINIGRFKRVKAIAIYGRHSFAIQKTELKQKNHVVVGTPGRVLDHIERGTINLKQIKYLVIDEADEMLNMGFIDQVEAIIKELPEERVTMLFSATLPEKVKNLSLQFMNNPVDIEINTESITVDKIEHVKYEVKEEDKLSLLTDITIVENPESCIIFCKTKERVDNLYRELMDRGYPCIKIHGDMEQEDRIQTMKDFRRGIYRYLIATDVAARGIDIDSISLIINYDIPRTKEVYVHRTGRTGRAGLAGKAITFVTVREDRAISGIEEYIGFLIPSMDRPSTEEVEEARYDFALKINQKVVQKKSKAEQLNKHIMTLYFNGGKKKKLRATNFVGVISNLEGVTAEDIGIITITETYTHVDILNDKGPLVLNAMKNTAICGKVLKVSEAKKK